MKPDSLTWPPLVKADKVPAGIRARDFLLTLLAWAAFCWMMMDAIQLAFDWLRPPFGRLTFLDAPDWSALWRPLRPFVQLTGLLVAWISFWAVYRRNTLRPQQTIPEAPVALDPELLCARYAVSVSQLLRWQQTRCVTVDVIEGGAIIAVATTRSAPTGSSDAVPAPARLHSGR
ncbi:MAG: hypothetical protein ACOYNZ_03655 [Rhodoferax sp.]